MNVLVSSSQHFVLTADGELWVANAAESYQFWTRYLEVYDEVLLCVRATEQATPPSGWIQSSGPGVRPVPLPDFYGPLEYLQNYRTIQRIAQPLVQEVEAIQLRIPCPVGNRLWQLLESRRPYGIEVISDPYDVFAAGAIQHPLRPFFRWYFPHVLRQQCRRACAVSYVTAQALQQRYPPGKATLATSYSDVELADDAFCEAPRPLREKPRLRLVMVGHLNQLYKAPHILLDAFAQSLPQIDRELELIFVGDGQFRSQLEAQTQQLGVAEQVCFTGQLAARRDVIEQLDRADLFLLPSLTEGLPRAMVEAMARALPCIGSTAGGIPELLPAEDLVPPGNVTALAAKICEVVADPARMARMSSTNLTRVRDFHECALQERRVSFYQHVKKQTEAWLCNN